MNVVAIVPARGGSKGLPRKNVTRLKTEPLIAYTIRAALGAVSVARTVVSTDDDEIAATAMAYGAEVPFRRPSALSTDEAMTEDAVIHAIRQLDAAGHIPDVVAVLEPTAPLRTARHIDEAVELLLRSGLDSVASVCEVDHPPEWIYRLDGANRLRPILATRTGRRQDAPPAYRLNGAIYVRSVPALLRDGRLVTDDTRAYVMARDESIDIDTVDDLVLCEAILARHG